MMFQRETGESAYEQAHPGNRRYTGERTSGHEHYVMFLEPAQHDGTEGKVYTSHHESKNRLRFRLAGMAMATIIIVAVLCLISGGSSVAWMGFGIGSFAVFLLATVAIDKIQ